MTRARLITSLTNSLHWVLKWFVKEEVLLKWKPIHLCWWFEKNGYETPKYFIGKAAFTANLNRFRFYADGSEDGSTPLANENTNYSASGVLTSTIYHLRVLIQ
jgi:hypothetical protein